MIRLDRAMPKYRADELHPPASGFDAELLERVIRTTARTVSAPVPDELGGGRIGWGDELDVQPIGAGQALEPRRCAGYLDKYATKATEQAGGVLHPVTDCQVERLPVREHVRGYLRSAFALDGELPERRLARTAHAFGYRGHCLTKSRRYSITFKALRQAREAFVRQQLLARSTDSTQRAIATATERIASFMYAGRGHFTAAEEYLARSAHARALEHRRLAREEHLLGSSGRLAASRGNGPGSGVAPAGWVKGGSGG